MKVLQYTDKEMRLCARVYTHSCVIRVCVCGMCDFHICVPLTHVLVCAVCIYVRLTWFVLCVRFSVLSSRALPSCMCVSVIVACGRLRMYVHVSSYIHGLCSVQCVRFAYKQTSSVMCMSVVHVLVVRFCVRK
jgi:hypothetical protein